jgi:hypothetical protein
MTLCDTSKPHEIGDVFHTHLYCTPHTPLKSEGPQDSLVTYLSLAQDSELTVAGFDAATVRAQTCPVGAEGHLMARLYRLAIGASQEWQRSPRS